LCGSVHAFAGTERDHAPLIDKVKKGEDWGPVFAQTDLVLAPAACYPLYPTQTGTLPKGGKLFDLTGFCFRHEPSDDPARLQSFELRENVRMGTPDDVRAWRAKWMERGEALAKALKIEARLATASDPFFGRGGKLMSASQKQEELKFELLVPIWSDNDPTACASFNYHQDHFGHVFEIHSEDGAYAHTACLGFGIDRLAIAMLRTHGLDPSRWPNEVRDRLGL
jgi:seryl-tRNA synthetase